MENWKKDFEKWWSTLDLAQFNGCNYKTTAMFAWKAAKESNTKNQQTNNSNSASGAVADIESIIDNLPENRCLYKDSGLWRITDEEFKKTLYEQEVNETFIEFINRVFKNENQLQEL